jgi:hypothetical protein
MRPLILAFVALVLPALFADSAQAQIFRRRPQVVNQINIGGGGAQFVQPYAVRQQVVRQKVIQQRFVQPVYRQQAVVQKVYAQPVVQQVYAQPIVVQQQAYGCQGGGLQLQQGSCQSFFAY